MVVAQITWWLNMITLKTSRNKVSFLAREMVTSHVKSRITMYHKFLGPALVQRC